LKLGYRIWPEYRLLVAPRAGAWIETNLLSFVFELLEVAPRAGAWIETGCSSTHAQAPGVSRPARARGLKH